MKFAPALALGILAIAARAQSVLNDPKKIADARAVFDALGGHSSDCELLSVKPHLNFTLRMQAGYMGRVPIREGEGQKWVVLAAIVPKGQPAVYLSDVVQLPDVPPGRAADNQAEISGAFWLGEGHYDAKVLMFNGRGDTCSGEWQIEAHLDPEEHKAAPLLAPRTVAEISWTGVRTSQSAPVVGRLTILLDAVPEVRAGRQVLVVDALAALLDELPARSVRLVMFDLTQQKEIFRRDGVTPEALPDVAKTVDAVQFEPVTVSALRNPRGGVDLIQNLVNQELHSPDPSDAVIFLGPKANSNANPSPSLALPPGAKLRFFYVLCLPPVYGRSVYWGPGQFSGSMPGTRMGAGAPGTGPSLNTQINGLPTWNNPNFGRDSVDYVVARLGGKTMMADSPRSFAEAVSRIRRLLGTK